MGNWFPLVNKTTDYEACVEALTTCDLQQTDLRSTLDQLTNVLIPAHQSECNTKLQTAVRQSMFGLGAMRWADQIKMRSQPAAIGAPLGSYNTLVGYLVNWDPTRSTFSILCDGVGMPWQTGVTQLSPPPATSNVWLVAHVTAEPGGTSDQQQQAVQIAWQNRGDYTNPVPTPPSHWLGRSTQMLTDSATAVTWWLGSVGSLPTVQVNGITLVPFILTTGTGPKDQYLDKDDRHTLQPIASAPQDITTWPVLYLAVLTQTYRP